MVGFVAIVGFAVGLGVVGFVGFIVGSLAGLAVGLAVVLPVLLVGESVIGFFEGDCKKIWFSSLGLRQLG